MPPVGDFHEIGERRLFADVEGQGNPPVVFLAGAGLCGLDYRAVQNEISTCATSVVYDRSGTGWSDSAPTPITSTAVTDEMHDLLQALGVCEPVVLVGHSLGGLYARHFAIRFPDEVAGLVLLDPGHEDYDAFMPQELNQQRGSDTTLKFLDMLVTFALRTRPTRGLMSGLPAVKRYATLYRRLFAEEMSDWSAEIRDSLIERHGSVEWLAVGLTEARGIEHRYAEVRAAGPMPNIPLIILNSTSTDPFQDAVSQGLSPELIRKELLGKTRLYKKLAASVPAGEVRPVASGHVTMPFRCAEDIALAVRDVSRP
jgi:pimeloyl-ACP methyl ester carboxylesterase